MNRRSCWIIMAFALLAGCGSDRIPVGGAVTFDGKPVAEGSISFEPADGQGPSTGGRIVAGRYDLTGEAAPLPGKKLVRVSAARKPAAKFPAVRLLRRAPSWSTKSSGTFPTFTTGKPC